MSKSPSKAAKPAPLRVTYQGEPGANSHIAALEVFPDCEPMPCATFEDALALVKSGEADRGMIAIENTLAGRVADVHHLLPNAGLSIVGEHFLRIRFHLMGIKGARLDGIRDVYSHVHALGQCRKIIRKHGLKAHITGDTAGAAREVAEWGDATRAALAPPLAAGIYGLDVLVKDVEDEAHNTTRFVVLAREPMASNSGDGTWVTSFVFNVRNVPAALYKAMGGFATNSVNITKLESYQLGGTFSATMFYADIEGRIDDPAVVRAMEELRYFSTEVRILGCYPASPLRAGLAPVAG